MLIDSRLARAADPALDALFVPVEQAMIDLRARRVLFLRARSGAALLRHAQAGWICQQSFKPEAERLEAAGMTVSEPDPAARFERVLLLPARQRDEARAQFARAVQHLAPGGVLLASVANSEGARSAEADLARLTGPLLTTSKHKCRVFRSAPLDGPLDVERHRQWLALDALRPVAGGALLSRPGLFCWDRIDTGSALLAAQLPSTLAGRVADLGGGHGYLSCELLRRCPGITAIDLFEAEGRALEPARQNLERAAADSGRALEPSLHWHDVSRGVAGPFDVIVSNPPFHQGRAGQPELGCAFIRAAAVALADAGSFWMVANRHLPYEATLSECFREVRCVTTADGFKVFEARGVRR
jgi:16S rRNA (guanine1207-N2)-methyltransferase